MAEAVPGLYEALVTAGLRARLDAIDDQLPARQSPLLSAEAADRIAWHLAQQIERALADQPEADRVEVGVRVATALLDRLGELVAVDPQDAPVEPATVLHAILRRRPDGEPDDVGSPLTPLLDTTLLTNAPGVPSLWSELRSEIASADRIDVVMAFIRRSDISPLLGALPPAPRRRPAAPHPHHHLHRLDRAPGPRPAHRTRSPTASPTPSAPSPPTASRS